MQQQLQAISDAFDSLSQSEIFAQKDFQNLFELHQKFEIKVNELRAFEEKYKKSTNHVNDLNRQLIAMHGSNRAEERNNLQIEHQKAIKNEEELRVLWLNKNEKFQKEMKDYQMNFVKTITTIFCEITDSRYKSNDLIAQLGEIIQSNDLAFFFKKLQDEDKINNEIKKLKKQIYKNEKLLAKELFIEDSGDDMVIICQNRKNTYLSENDEKEVDNILNNENIKEIGRASCRERV